MKPLDCRIPDDRREPLTEEERAVFAWQFPVAGFGEAGQERLKASSILVTRCGGLGGSVAYQLAAAGVGRLILAHGGDIQASDLNRQILMTHAGIGHSRVESAARRLKELNPALRITAVPENVLDSNVARLVRDADLVVDCAPMFGERYLLNDECVLQRKPMVEAAVFELEAHLTTVIPGVTPCLRCLYPETSPTWTRRFPVFGAVSATVGALAAMEAIKLLAGFGETLAGILLACDLGNMSFRRFRIRRDPHCPECGGVDVWSSVLGGS